MTPQDQVTETSKKVCDLLGLTHDRIVNIGGLSNYIKYSSNGVCYELRVSNHCANEKRVYAKQLMGYQVIDLSNDFNIAKQEVMRKVFGKIEEIKTGTIVNHNNYGIGYTIKHNLSNDSVSVDFNGTIKNMVASLMLERNFIK